MSEKPRKQIPYYDVVDMCLPAIKHTFVIGKKHGFGMDVHLGKETEQERLQHILKHLKARFNKGEILDEDDGDKSHLASVIVWCMIQMVIDMKEGR